MVNFKKFNK